MSGLNIIDVITDWQQSHEYHACVLPSEVVDERNALSNVVGYIGKIEENNKRLREALTGVVDMYCCLINSGDAGNWSPEEDDEIIAARKALSQEGE